jgi:orotidine-5'-phosphate decarboxylase
VISTHRFSDVRDRLVFPLDVGSLDEAVRYLELLKDDVGVFKIGLELFVRHGAEAVRLVKQSGRRCFLDLKLHDIEETVARATAAALDLEADYLTVHASSGAKALARLAKVAEGSCTELLAVTVLTSFDDEALRGIGVTRVAEDQVAALGRLAFDAGVRGFVASPLEARALRESLGPSALIVTPGVRPAASDHGDQKRVATPGDALRNGADVVVVGRPIRDASDPQKAAQSIVRELDSAAKERT